jgi:hypothetical protein
LGDLQTRRFGTLVQVCFRCVRSRRHDVQPVAKALDVLRFRRGGQHTFGFREIRDLDFETCDTHL